MGTPAHEAEVFLENQTIQTVQTLPDAESGISFFNLLESAVERSPLLPTRGTMARLSTGRRVYYHEGNTLFRGAIAGLTKKIQSTPYQIKADEEIYGNYWNLFIETASFGNWETFISELVLAYSIFDTGAFVEIIAPGAPDSPPTGPASGIAMLDSLNCWPTGDPEFPVIYYNAEGEMHKLHHTRVIQFVDMPERSNFLYGWGDCSLSRCITPIHQEILMAQYNRTQLDDAPTPGMLLLKNLNEEDVLDAVAKMRLRQENDEDLFGRVTFLYGVATEIVPEIVSVAFNAPPESFDYEKFTVLDVKKIALGIGIDIQEIWELTGAGIGTGTQSEILAKKSKGRAIGRLLKGIERMINDIFPSDVEFKFHYRDEEEDLQFAQIASTWASAVSTMVDLSPETRAMILKNQIEGVGDAVAMVENIPSNPEIVDDVGGKFPEEEEQEEGIEIRAFHQTSRKFIIDFNDILSNLIQGALTPGGSRILFRSLMQKAGRQTYLDGLRRTGIRPQEIGDQGERRVSAWASDQSRLITRFVSDVLSKGLTEKQAQLKGLQWSNGSLEQLLYQGMTDAKPSQNWKWVINFAKENCITCLKLHGQIHTMRAFTRLGLLPKSVRLVCTGQFCGCGLKKTDEKASGRLRSVRFVRRFSLS